MMHHLLHRSSVCLTGLGASTEKPVASNRPIAAATGRVIAGKGGFCVQHRQDRLHTSLYVSKLAPSGLITRTVLTMLTERVNSRAVWTMLTAILPHSRGYKFFNRTGRYAQVEEAIEFAV
jgi:hypothetical protein